MKWITAIIKPFKLEQVRDALKSIGITGVTVSDVKGFGRQKGHAEFYRGAEYAGSFVPKIKLEVAIEDDRLDEVTELLRRSACTGKIGDGKIFVATLEQAVRIRTMDVGSEAL